MGLGGCAKIIFIPINTSLMLVGLAACAGGVIMAFFPGKVLDKAFDIVKEAINSQTQFSGISFPKEADELKDAPYLFELGVAILALGAFIFALSWMGWCGACCTSCCKCLLVLFAVILLVMIAAEITAGTMFLVKDSPLHENLKSELKKKITEEYDEKSNNAFSAIVILANNIFDCCGVDGYTDFGNKSHYSCGNYTSTGCYTKLTDLIQDNIVWAGLILAGVLLLQLLQVIFAIAIFKDSNKVSPF